jgi:methyl-accepting chemotaxis protein
MHTLQTYRAALLEIAGGEQWFDLGSEEADLVRSKVYWYLDFLREELRPISDGVRVSPPRTRLELDDVVQKINPLSVDLVALFGHARNVMDLVDDDENSANGTQIVQLMDLHEQLVGAVADYSDVLEEIVGGSTNRSKARNKFIAAFRQLQNKLEAIVEGLEDWRQ